MTTDYLTTQPEWMRTERLVNLEGAFNLRDLGGYPTRDGRMSAFGKIFRSDDLHSLTPHDLRELAKRELRTVIDFRAQQEAQAAPDLLAETVINTFHLPIDPANVTTLKHTVQSIDPGLMLTIYRLLVREFRPVYRQFFDIIQQEEAAAALFHCSGGKDRTGLAAALFLAALGVEHGVIMHDYMVSKQRAELKYAREIELKPELAPLLTVSPEYLEAAFTVINKEFGGMESFLVNELNADLELLRRLYTVDFPS